MGFLGEVRRRCIFSRVWRGCGKKGGVGYDYNLLFTRVHVTSQVGAVGSASCVAEGLKMTQ